MEEFQNYYEVLEIPETASQAEIKTAYRVQAQHYHPDKVPEHLTKLRKDAEEKFKLIDEVYKLLSDPQKRRQYDEMLRQMKKASAGSSSENSPPFQSSSSAQQPASGAGSNAAQSWHFSPTFKLPAWLLVSLIIAFGYWAYLFVGKAVHEKAQRDELQFKQASQTARTVLTELYTHPLARYASNDLAQISYVMAASQPRDRNSLAGCLKSSAELRDRLNTASNALSCLVEQEGKVVTSDMEAVAAVEWTEFKKAYALVNVQTNLNALIDSVKYSQICLDQALAAMRGRQANWAKVVKARDDATRILNDIQQHPLLGYAQSDVAVIAAEYSNTVARLTPTGEVSQQLSALAHTKETEEELLGRFEDSTAQTLILAQLKRDLIGEETSIRQFAPERMNEFKQVMGAVEASTALATHTGHVARAIKIVTAAFDESDAKRLGKK